MKRFFVKNEMDYFVSQVYYEAVIQYCEAESAAFSLPTRKSAEMFIRFLATLTDSKMSIVEVEK